MHGLVKLTETRMDVCESRWIDVSHRLEGVQFSELLARARDVPAGCIRRPEPRSRQGPDASGNAPLRDLCLHEGFLAFSCKSQGPCELDVPPSPLRVDFDGVAKAGCSLLEVAP